MATGGITNGKSTTVSVTLLSGQSFRARSQEMAIPKGRIKRVLRNATPRENSVMYQVSGDKESPCFSFYGKTTKPYFSNMARAALLNTNCKKSLAACFFVESFTIATGYVIFGP